MGVETSSWMRCQHIFVIRLSHFLFVNTVYKARYCISTRNAAIDVGIGDCYKVSPVDISYRKQFAAIHGVRLIMVFTCFMIRLIKRNGCGCKTSPVQ